MSTSNWILGIGDRHLDNLMLDQKTGELVGIDFNLAFGAGTRDQSIPELVPFRLTIQFVNVLRPMETSGLLQKCMAHALRTFRNDRRLLMDCMKVFIEEPTINWLLPVQQSEQSSLESSQSVETLWEPKQRIKIINDKLMGGNPCSLLAEDLKNGFIAK